MSHALLLSPDLLVQMPHWHIIDIRHEQERRDASLGFIPSSLSICDKDLQTQKRFIIKQVERQPVVLTCLSGRRSEQLVEELIDHHDVDPSRLATLEGGLLAWRAQDLPISGVDIFRHPPLHQPHENIFAHLRACFVAQLTETMLDHDAAVINPIDLLHQCLEEASHHPESSIVRWEYVLDHAAAISRQHGTDLQVIAENLDNFLRQLHT